MTLDNLQSTYDIDDREFTKHSTCKHFMHINVVIFGSYRDHSSNFAILLQ